MILGFLLHCRFDVHSEVGWSLDFNSISFGSKQMNAKLVASVVMALIIGIAVSSILQHEARANPNRSEGFEYKVISLSHDPAGPAPRLPQDWADFYEKKLNDLAKDGWEFAGTMGTGSVALRRAKK